MCIIVRVLEIINNNSAGGVEKFQAEVCEITRAVLSAVVSRCMPGIVRRAVMPVYTARILYIANFNFPTFSRYTSEV